MRGYQSILSSSIDTIEKGVTSESSQSTSLTSRLFILASKFGYISLGIIIGYVTSQCTLRSDSVSAHDVVLGASSPSVLSNTVLLLADDDGDDDGNEEWKQWTCDELTPNLCDLQVETGSVVIRSIPIKYWRYKRKNRNVTATSHPIIAIHGGPGYPHNYILPLKQLACSGNEVIFYDQAGCGQSTIEKGTPVSVSDHPHILDPVYYSEEELPALIDHWKLDKYHVLGHSWGTMLAQLFALNAENTSGMQSIILAGPLSDAKSYIAAQWDEEEGNLGSLPPFIQGRLHSLETEGLYESKEYQAIGDVLTTFFTLRTAPAPDCFTDAVSGLNVDVYKGMQGPSEFTFGGVLADFNVTGRLHEIDVPVLLTHGVYDTMRPSIVKTMEKELKYAERVLFPHSGHVSMIDDPELMNGVVSDFVNRVES